MRCVECGADLPGDETCEDRFHALLLAEQHSREAAEMHGLTVLMYHFQHPLSGKTKSWWQAFAQLVLWESFGRGRNWLEVLQANNSQRQVDAWKARWASVPGPLLPATPTPGEMTIGDIPAEAPPGHADRVLAWARSVSEARGLTTAPPVFEV